MGKPFLVSSPVNIHFRCRRQLFPTSVPAPDDSVLARLEAVRARKNDAAAAASTVQTAEGSAMEGH